MIKMTASFPAMLGSIVIFSDAYKDRDLILWMFLSIFFPKTLLLILTLSCLVFIWIWPSQIVYVQSYKRYKIQCEMNFEERKNR